jgi:hypothetical protein
MTWRYVRADDQIALCGRGVLPDVGLPPCLRSVTYSPLSMPAGSWEFVNLLSSTLESDHPNGRPEERMVCSAAWPEVAVQLTWRTARNRATTPRYPLADIAGACSRDPLRTRWLSKSGCRDPCTDIASLVGWRGYAFPIHGRQGAICNGPTITPCPRYRDEVLHVVAHRMRLGNTR